MFSRLSGAELEQLWSMFEEVELARGEILFYEGTEGDHAYLIQEGSINILKACAQGEVLLAVRKKGDIIGEMALLDCQPRMAKAQAAEDSLLRALHKDNFEHLMTTSPSAARGAIDLILPRWRETEVVLNHRECELLEKSTELEQAMDELQYVLTEAQNARTLAENASQAKSRFLANMSHELRTPLNAIIGYAEILMEEADQPDGPVQELLPDLGKIHEASRYLLQLIGNMLDLAKIEAGKLELELVRFPISALLQDVVGTIRPLIDKKGNELHVDCPEDIGQMYGDMTKVRQILFNLLSNAAKFTEGGSISCAVQERSHPPLDLEHEGPWLCFRVSDTGVGMTPEQTERVFQEFDQAHSSRKYGGTGLGLPISRRLCERMGGTIIANSQLGEGTQFHVWLPRELGD